MYSLGVKQQRFIHSVLSGVVVLSNSNDTFVWRIYIVLYLLIQPWSISNTVRGYTNMLRSNYHLHSQTLCTYLFHNFNLDTNNSFIQCILCITLFILDAVASLHYCKKIYINKKTKHRETLNRYRCSLHFCWVSIIDLSYWWRKHLL